ncbi:MAG: hypothetical protein QOG53_1231 [Frankiales bacterium]|nr:hypothetical protein [Frankiales bacterium]
MPGSAAACTTNPRARAPGISRGRSGPRAGSENREATRTDGEAGDDQQQAPEKLALKQLNDAHDDEYDGG